MANHKRVIVIGGGISGLAAGYDLTRAGLDCTILEKQNRAGGVIETRTTASGCTLDCGPDSFLSAKPEALALVKELGLEQDVIGSNDHQRTTFIWKNNRLLPLPEGIMMMVPSRAMPVIKSPLLGWGTKLKMGLEYFRQPPPVASPDRSVSDFVSDHFGQETLDYLAEPLLSGVYGGDPAFLSIRSVMPRFADMETKYGSLVRGVLASRRKNASGGGPLFRTLKGGLGALVAALASKVKLCQTEAASIEKTEIGFRVFANGAWMEAANVVVACPAWSASHLLHALDQPLAAQLGEIGYSSSVILSLIYDASAFNGIKAGFGFLVPKKERNRLAACTYVGTKFAHRTPENRIVLRCFFGGIGDGAVLEESDESIIAMAHQELRHKLGLTIKPIDHLISRWPRAMAQYNVGHAKRIAEIRARAAAIPGLYLAGNAYEGIGIPDCIRTGRAAAAQIVQTAE